MLRFYEEDEKKKDGDGKINEAVNGLDVPLYKFLLANTFDDNPDRPRPFDLGASIGASILKASRESDNYGQYQMDVLKGLRAALKL